MKTVFLKTPLKFLIIFLCVAHHHSIETAQGLATGKITYSLLSTLAQTTTNFLLRLGASGVSKASDIVMTKMGLSATINDPVLDAVKSAEKGITVNPLVSFAIMGIVFAGWNFAVARIGEQEQEVIKQYAQKQIEATKAYDEFQKNIQQQQINAITSMSQTFADRKKKLEDQFNASGQRLQAEIQYLQRAVNLDRPLQQFLDSWIEWDRFFETSRMRVPGNLPWYNIFNVFNQDDWQYDLATNAFWQNSLTSFPATLFWNEATEKRNILAQDPSLHHIFNEYITNAPAYEIEIECKLVNCTYPFFMGIVFNRGRWISGDPERLWWYRVLGLYGYEKIDESKNKQQEIMLDCAQLRIVRDEQEPSKRKIISPLEDIIQNRGLLKKSVDPKIVQTIKTDPITVVMRITNKPSAIDLNIAYKLSNNQPEISLFTGTVSSLDEYLYRFHGIGFMAIGCQASFSIKKPTDIAYTTTDMEKFKQQSVETSKSVKG